MYKPYELLENVLIDIEKELKEDIKINVLAKKYDLTDRHLRRLFKFAFNKTLGEYNRSRRLSASLYELLKTNFDILDIAIEYGFEYEESYIRAFKREFKITPGQLRKTGKVVKVTPPLQLFNAKKTSNGVLFGPEIVMVPQFHVIGKLYVLPSRDLAVLTPKMVREFWDNDHSSIKNATDPDELYIGLARNYNFGEGTAEYLASVPVKNLEDIPPGLNGDTFDTSLCARFRYIGQHHYYDLHREIMQPMYDEIYKFRTSETEKYALKNDKVYFEKLDSRHYDGTYCQMEWFAPVVERS
jgi:AraC family transcriptional regulator